MTFMLRKIYLLGLLTGVLCLGASSCGGGATNNDQGTSFLALGFFTVVDDEIVPSTQAIVPLATDSSNFSNNNGLRADGNLVFRLLGMENRLSEQFIRATRVDCSYDVQGADIGLAIPDDSVSKSFVLGATDTTEDNFAGDENVRPQAFFMSVPVVTTDIMSFLNVNRNSLPELPYTLTATCEVVGITEAGDVLTTNPVSLSVLLTDVSECCTGTGVEGAGGFQLGLGVGGGISSFGSPDEDTGAIVDSEGGSTTNSLADGEFVIE